MSTSQPIWRSRLPAKSPPSDPPMIKARRFLEISPSALLFVSPISRFPTKAAEHGCRSTWLGICRSGGCASDPTGRRFCLTCVGSGKRHSHHILLQQIDRYSEENHVLHQKKEHCPPSPETLQPDPSRWA